MPARRAADEDEVRRERVLQIVREIQESLTDEDRDLLRREAVEMYDEYGLPR